jgi:integrase/recombinase XerD
VVDISFVERQANYRLIWVDVAFLSVFGCRKPCDVSEETFSFLSRRRVFMFVKGAKKKIWDAELAALVQEFLLFAEVEAHFSRETVSKYEECIRRVEWLLGVFDPSTFGKAELLRLKQILMQQVGASRQTQILLALKRFLQFLRDEKKMAVLEPEEIRPPKRPRRAVEFLTVEEVQAFTGSIRLLTYDGETLKAGVRFKALVELLLGSAMRISEALALNRNQIDFEKREAKIIGKGNKERTVFFTARALHWLQHYLNTRTDEGPALFVTETGRGRLKRPDIWRLFRRFQEASGVKKRITPHLLRHTAATQLLFNGCPIGHIKEILGHERLETTCRYYLGLDRRAAKAAHEKFLQYSPGN